MFDIKFAIDYQIMRVRLARLADQVIPKIRTTWKEIADWADHQVRLHTPTEKSGRDSIRTSWKLDQTKQGAIEEYVIHNIYPKPEVVGYFEKGTRPHFIHPVNALALHFKAGDGTDVFTKYVYHPGTVAWHMVELTKQDVQGKLNQYMQDTFDMVDKMMNAGGVTP